MPVVVVVVESEARAEKNALFVVVGSSGLGPLDKRP